MESTGELDLAANSWNHMIDSASTTGYRRGLEDGSDSVLQEGFDKGYGEGFETTFLLGQYKGLSSVLSKDIEHPAEINAILKETKKGGCYMCTLKKEEEQEKPFENILECQQEHSRKIFTILYNYFKPMMEKHGINIGHRLLVE